MILFDALKTSAKEHIFPALAFDRKRWTTYLVSYLPILLALTV
jgi:hypothetical protein